MINLIPEEMRENLLYARRNTQLLRWTFIMLIIIASIFAVVFIGQIYINREAKSYAAQNETAQQQLKSQKLEETQKQVESISSSVKLAVEVLSRQVLFSSLLKQIGAAMPQGSVLTGLSINKLEGGIDLSAAAKDYQTATQVQVNLQDPNNKIFDKADIVSIECGGTNNTNGQTAALDTQYPCKVTIRALFSKNNPFLLIKNQSSGAQ